MLEDIFGKYLFSNTYLCLVTQCTIKNVRVVSSIHIKLDGGGKEW